MLAEDQGISDRATEDMLLGTLDDAAVAELDEAASGAGIDIDLLRSTPARDIRAQIEAVLTLLQDVDHRALLAKQGFFSRLTGADVEARLRFEISAQQVISAVARLREAALAGRRLRRLLAEARRDLDSEQERLQAVIAAAQALLGREAGTDGFARDRFERRLASIMALHAANILTLGQMVLAEGVLDRLLDRCTDVDTLIIPLWQRHAFALAQAAGHQTFSKAAQDFTDTHRHLIAHLEQDARI
ncbi:hypothetical protein [Bosea sp. BK604]|uniref:hypothetical protein n=1 Tax=Bosea sp. BK604 TaxID=2512180 RepID=UPI001050E026|nr:hypothetical protein [Bosea sp. BK604]TCR60579.1 hypothetical protein EV560_11666 [Bosea sp. BK604]